MTQRHRQVEQTTQEGVGGPTVQAVHSASSVASLIASDDLAHPRLLLLPGRVHGGSRESNNRCTKCEVT
jgi:hypothetical protein